MRWLERHVEDVQWFGAFLGNVSGIMTCKPIQAFQCSCKHAKLDSARSHGHDGHTHYTAHRGLPRQKYSPENSQNSLIMSWPLGIVCLHGSSCQTYAHK